MEKLVTSADAGGLKNLALKYDIANGNYLGFIGEVRGMARYGDKLSHGRPILPLEVDANPPYICVNLQESGLDKGVATIRRYDLRLISFEDVCGNVVDVNEYKLYDDDSRLLDFGIDGFMLGLNTFVEAVAFLANCCKTNNIGVGTSFLVKCDKKQLTNPQESSNMRISLAVLCLVLCEAIKLEFLSCLLGNAFKLGLKVPLTSWLLHRINDWVSLSQELLFDYHSNTADCDLYLPDTHNDWHDGLRMIGVTCQDIAQFLGILRPFPPDDPMPDDDCLPGTCLLEVYSVRVYINGGRSGNVYGSIKIDNGHSTYHIYDRDSSKCEYVESHGTLSLQDPEDFITVSGNIDMIVDIREEGGENLEISKGKLSWGSLPERYLYDSRLSAMVSGENGYVIVNYSVFKNAVPAQLEVRLLKDDYRSDFSRRLSCAHGVLTTRYSHFSYTIDYHRKYFQTTLFSKPFVSNELLVEPCTSELCKGGEKVEEELPIKLARSKVAVPVDSSLNLVADLKCCKGMPIMMGSSIDWLPLSFDEFQFYVVGDSEATHQLYVRLTCVKMETALK